MDEAPCCPAPDPLAVCAGTLVQSGMLQSAGSDGATLAQVLENHGFESSPAGVMAVARNPRSIKGYLEVHMEQGPVLQSSQLPLGVVSGIAGQARLRVQVYGSQGHAGAPPEANGLETCTAAT